MKYPLSLYQDSGEASNQRLSWDQLRPVISLLAPLCYTTAMIVGVSEITLHLPESHSLKEKRQVVKSVIARVRNQFEVAIAEVSENDLWQIAKLGVSCVSNNRQHADEVLHHVRRYIEEARPDVVVTEADVEIINW
ncbi:MAG TPA: DUF503 domain-containing protein [Ktedonobacteraceae bacterium]|nr:DUF503 domain-containing protein [Ktedonobacteraceae bacterium]